MDASPATAATSPLRMVEDIERFSAKFESHGLSKFKELQQGHIKVSASRHVEDVTTRISERQTTRSAKCASVKQQRTGASRVACSASRCIVRISDQVCVRSGTGTVSHASVVRETAVDHAKGYARLHRRDARELPTSEKIVLKARLFEEGKIVDITEIQRVPLIEVGARPAPCYVIRIDDAWCIECASIGCVIDGVAVGVSDAERQGCNCAPCGELKSVVVRIRRKLQKIDAAITEKRPERIGIIAASDAKIGERLSGDRDSTRSRSCGTVVRPNRFAWLVRVFRR